MLCTALFRINYETQMKHGRVQILVTMWKEAKMEAEWTVHFDRSKIRNYENTCHFCNLTAGKSPNKKSRLESLYGCIYSNL